MIIDLHTHAFPDRLAARALAALEEHSGDYKALLDGTVSGLLRSMDQAGIRVAAVCSIATHPRQVDSILQWSEEIASERIIPFPSVHPAGDCARQMREIAQRGFKGIKLHPQYQSFAVDAQEAFPIYEAAAETGLLVALHAGWDIAFPGDESASPDKIARVVEKFPGMRMVAYHLGGWREWDLVLEHLAGKDLYFDTSFTLGDASPEMVEQIIARHGWDKVVFGSDSPWADQAAEVAKIRALGLDPQTERDVLRGTAARLLGLLEK
mgnify:CR=1 FL=1